MAEVTEVNCIEQLQSYRLLWKSLFPHTPRASFFHTFEWFENYWKHYGKNRKMRVLVVHAAGKPIGIVPLCVQHERYQVGKVRVLTYPLKDWGMWYGPIGPHQSACLFMAARHLRETARDWDLIDLRWAGQSGSVCQATARALRYVGWEVRPTAYQQTSNIQLTDSNWDGYLASRSKKWRHESRRQVRGMEREGDISFERYRPSGAAGGEENPNWPLYEKCLAISRKSWQAESRNGNTICHANVEPFLRDCHEAAARLGMLDVTLLRLDDVPIAYQYNYVYDGTVTGLRIGFDSQYTALSPGNVLLFRSLEDSFNRGDTLIEMGIGESRFKQRIRTHVETNYRLTYYPWSAWRAQGVRLTQLLKRRSAIEETKQPVGT